MSRRKTIAKTLFALLISISVIIGITGCKKSEETALVQDGYKIYTVYYLEDIPKDKPPKTGGNELITFATPGEFEPLSFVIYADKDLGNVDVHVSDLHSEDNIIKSDNIELRLVKWLDRRKEYTSPIYDLIPTPYFLETYKPFTLNKGEFKEVWLTIYVPKETPAGVYTSEVIVKPENKESQTVKLTFEVLPFQLRESKKLHSVYYGHFRLRSKEERARDFQDMRDHGLQHVITRSDATNLRYKWVMVGNERKVSVDFSRPREVIEELQSFGFVGPYLVESGFGTLWNLVNGDPELYKETIADVMEGIFEFERDMGVEVLLACDDEIFATKEQQEQYERLVRPAAELGGKFYMTLAPQSDDSKMLWLDPMVHIRSYEGNATDKWLATNRKTFEDLRTYGNPSNDTLWLYYNPVYAYITPRWHRIINGIYLWMSPFELQGFWAYSRVHCQHISKGNVFDDTDGPRGTVGMAFVDPRDNTLLLTRDWEGYREGVDDLRYITTLEELIIEKGNEYSDVAKEAQKFLDDLKKDWWPKSFPPVPYDKTTYRSAVVRGMDTEHTLGSIRDIRRKIADYIIALLGLPATKK